ncbi:MAG: threonine/serine exporter family protein [Andreesenia angusta]|nr:threonine/serine exporter family protein [Andreesenia angusta]
MPYNIPAYNSEHYDDIDLNLTIKEKKERKAKARRSMNMIVLAGEIMLQSGAETYRVEDTIIRLAKSIDIVNYVDVFVIPTGIFLTFGYDNNINTIIKRTQIRSIDLNKITLVNEFSRDFTSSDMTVAEGMSRLKRIQRIEPYKFFTKAVLGGGLIGSFSAMLFGGSYQDLIAAFFVSTIVIGIKTVFGPKFSMISYINDFFASLLIGLFSFISVSFGIGENLNEIIIGCLMPLVPGFAITNATRDSISGDFLAGMSRASEAIISALSIAFGVGLAIKFITHFELGGGI